MFILNNSDILLLNAKPQNKQMHCQILPKMTCNPCGNTMKISCSYHRLLIYDVKRTTKIDGMGPFNHSDEVPDGIMNLLAGIRIKNSILVTYW